MGELNYETRHKLKPHDFAILDKFEFKYAPVGFKFFNVEGDLEGLDLEPFRDREVRRRCEDGLVPDAARGPAGQGLLCHG